MKGLRRSIALALLVTAASGVAACGSDDDRDPGGGKATAAAATASEVPAPPTSPPTKIGVTKPLVKTPPKGKTVAWLQCSLPSCETFTPGFKAATQALGWKLETITYASPNAAPAVQQAVNQGVDYIANTGVPPALFERQLAAAHAKGIPFISANDVTPPSTETGYVTNFGDQTMFGEQSVQLAQWALRDSGNKAHLLYVLIPDYPILKAGIKPLEETFEKHCSGCSVDTLNVTVDDLGAGKVPSKLVAYLQSHPEVNYVDFSFADLLNGVEPALASAGLTDKVKLVGQALGNGPQVVEAIKKRTVAAWVAQPNLYQSWLMVDAMARLSVGMPLAEERKAAKQPTWVVDSPESAEPLTQIGGWDGPAGFEDGFKELWGI